VLGGVDFKGSVDFDLLLYFELFLALLCHFAWFYRFLRRLLAFTIFPLLDDLFELFLIFWVF
jgi:hypothetical protein